jgi:hypothetical protein
VARACRWVRGVGVADAARYLRVWVAVDRMGGRSR